MGEVVTYANSSTQCFCQLKLSSGERILISIATAPAPSVMVKKLVMGGLIPVQTIWEYNTLMAGGYNAYIDRLMIMLIDPLDPQPKHPLDALRDMLLPCRSIDEVRSVLLDAERAASF